MSMADDYDFYSWGEIEEWRESLRIDIDENGKETCANCHSDNIKVSKKGNKYCGEICWEEQPAIVSPELGF